MGLILITITLFALAMINVVTKKTATISGSIFTIVFFLAFFLSERQNREKQQQAAEERDKFQLDEQACGSFARSATCASGQPNRGGYPPRSSGAFGARVAEHQDGKARRHCRSGTR